MTEIAEQTGRGAAGSGQSTTEQAKEKAQETAQHVQEKAQEVKGQAGGRIRQELDTRSTQAGSQLQSTAEAMRRTGEQLQQEGKAGPAKVTNLVAERAERLGSYMTAANADQIVRDVEDFARRQPWLVAVGGATLGFFASRFLKASSSSRYDGGNGSGSYRQPGPQSVNALPPGAGFGTSGSVAADDGVDEPVSRGASASERGGSGGESGQ